MPEKEPFPWKRFWAVLGEEALSSEGFLIDPEAEFGRIENPHARSLEELSAEACLVLLGSAGAGKTYAVNQEFARLNAAGTEPGVRLVDLAAFASEQHLFRDLFEASWFKAWKEGTHPLVLFLDSFDECLLDFRTLAKVLLAELGNCPTERLMLRIVCRSADWPPGFEEKLGNLWGQGRVKVLVLQPLRQTDVALAAESNGIDAEAFRVDVRSHRAAALAVQPITLKFLLETYRAQGRLPSSTTELFEKGCLRLSEEINFDRLQSGHTGRLTAVRRLQIAARVAALQVLGNRYALWVGLPETEASAEYLLPTEVIGASGQAEGFESGVDRSDLEEVMATALFSSRGVHALGFAHRSYAEFLAARYLVSNGLSVRQVLPLLTEAGDGKLSVVPQLAGTVGWLAGMAPGVLHELLPHGPEIVLRGDLAKLGDEEREAIAAALLRAFDEERLLDVGRDLHLDYAKLSHPRLGSQLLPFIRDKSKGPVVRRVAIDIAECCQLSDLQEPLVELFLDASDKIETRVQAGWAISRLADSTWRSRVQPMLDVEPSDDPDDELKGCALKALWPGLITSDELFACLNRPQRSHLLGAYRSFLWDLPATLRPADIPAALSFLNRMAPIQSLDPLDNLADGIIEQTVKFALETSVFDRLLEHLANAIQQADFEWGYRQRPRLAGLLADKPALRLKFSAELLRRLPTGDHEWQTSIHNLASLLGPADVPWMLDQLEGTEDESIRRGAARLISLHFQACNVETADLVVAATRRIELLANELRWAIGPVELDSEMAQSMRELYERRSLTESERIARSEVSPPAEVRISELLNQSDAKHPDTWLRIDSELLRSAEHPQFIDQLTSNVTKGWAWPRLNEETRTRVMKAAHSFLLHADPAPKEWLGTTHVSFVALAGYRVLRLFQLADPAALTNLPAEAWSRWACIIVAFPTSSGNDEWEAPHRRLVRMAYQNAPEETIRTLMTVIDKEAKDGSGHLFILRKFDVWDDRFARALLDKAGDTNLRTESLRCLLTALLEHKVLDAVVLAESLLGASSQATTGARERAIAAAEALTSVWPEIGWERAWTVVSTDRTFGREVLGWLFHHARSEDAVIRKLTEAQLERLYIVLEEEFPGAAYEARAEGATFVGPEDSARMAKQVVLEELKARGTPDAVTAIRAIRQALPHVDWLKWAVLSAEQARVAMAWQPPKPSEVLALARSREKRFVESVHELLIVVKESLMRLEEELHGETPAVQFLWDDSARNARPKDEGALSDFVKWHLDRDLKARGVIVNREVEIRSRRSSEQGERVDIHVDAIRPRPEGDADRLKVIIEVKACWNPELKSAMETQLVDRYLAENPGAGGLYLVGWFNCPQWDGRDHRRQAPNQFDSLEATENLFR